MNAIRIDCRPATERQIIGHDRDDRHSTSPAARILLSLKLRIFLEQ
jgi:hypothetical protein